jgi:hypothetical protein
MIFLKEVFMRLKNKTCVAMLGLAAWVASGAAVADEKQICSDIAKEVTAGTLKPPVNEVYLGVFARLHSTYNEKGRGGVHCVGGDCVVPNGGKGEGVLGFLKMGGATVTYSGAADAAQINGILVNFALCQNGAPIEQKLKDLNKQVHVCMNGSQSVYGPMKPYKPGVIAGFMGLSYSSEGGNRSYPVSFEGIVEKDKPCDGIQADPKSLLKSF